MNLGQTTSPTGSQPGPVILCFLKLKLDKVKTKSNKADNELEDSKPVDLTMEGSSK